MQYFLIYTAHQYKSPSPTPCPPHHAPANLEEKKSLTYSDWFLVHFYYNDFNYFSLCNFST